MSGKMAVVVSEIQSVWESCKIITPNLVEAYRIAFKDRLSFYNLTAQTKNSEIWKLSKEIYDANPERIVFVDHYPHPDVLLLSLKEHYGNKRLPPLYFHIYGDFTLYLNLWEKLEKILQKTSVTFICASSRQANLVSRFLLEPNQKSLQVCHFPVDEARYFAQETLRKTWRKKLDLSPNTFAVVYTGRLSLQKNTMFLMQKTSEFLTKAKRPYKILLAGSFDDLGAPLFGWGQKYGEYYQDWQAQIDLMPKEARSKITHLGHYGPSDLAGLYNAADLYASFSLHHDEDFGMSPAEALCCGTAAALTAWGGYTSFNICEKSCAMIPVEIGATGLLIDYSAFRVALQRFSKPSLFSARNERSRLYLSAFSIEAAVQRLLNIHERPGPLFGGFNRLITRLNRVKESNIPFPRGPIKDTIYEEIYGAYVR